MGKPTKVGKWMGGPPPNSGVWLVPPPHPPPPPPPPPPIPTKLYNPLAEPKLLPVQVPSKGHTKPKSKSKSKTHAKCGCPPPSLKSGDSGNYDYEKEIGLSIQYHKNKMNLRTRRRTVYGILCFQLLWAAGIIPLFSYHDGIKSFLRSENGKALSIGITVTGMVALLAVLFFKGLRQKSPQNLIMLGALTLIYEVVIGGVSTVYDPNVMSLASVVLVAICVGLVGLALQTRLEELKVGQGILLCCLGVMFISVILFNFIPLPRELTPLKKIYACWGAMTITMYFTGLLVTLLS